MAKERRKGGDRKGDRRGGAGDRKRVYKKKVSVLTSESITWVDYKDVNLLRRFMSERAKIRARRVTGNSAQQQRAVARAIRVAREMALLPYSVRQVTQRKGGRRERERELGRDLGREMPPPPTPPDTAEGPIDEATADVEGAEVESAESPVPAEAAAPDLADPASDEPVGADADEA